MDKTERLEILIVNYPMPMGYDDRVVYLGRRTDVECAMPVVVATVWECSAEPFKPAYLEYIEVMQHHRGEGLSKEMLNYITNRYGKLNSTRLDTEEQIVRVAGPDGKAVKIPQEFL